MRPVFKQAPLALASPGQSVEVAAVVGAESREGRKIMSAGQDVDAVDLVQVHAVKRTTQMPGSWWVGALRAETLRRERNAPRVPQADRFSHHDPKPARRSGSPFSPMASWLSSSIRNAVSLRAGRAIFDLKSIRC